MTDFQFPDVMPTQFLVYRDQFQFTDDFATPEVTVTKGFITDGASTGRILQSLYPSYYRYFPAAAVHDFCYGHGSFSRKECDALFRDNMRYRLKLSWRYWAVMWFFVRLFGASHYTKRQAEGNTIESVK